MKGTIWVMDNSTGKPAAEFLDYKGAKDYCLKENGELQEQRYYIDRFHQGDDNLTPIREAVARGWCHQDQEHPGRVMDAYLAEAVVEEVAPLVTMPTARIKELEAGIEELYEEVRGVQKDRDRLLTALGRIQSELGVPGQGPSPHPQADIRAANTCIYNAFDIATVALDYWKDAESKGASDETQAVPVS